MHCARTHIKTLACRVGNASTGIGELRSLIALGFLPFIILFYYSALLPLFELMMLWLYLRLECLFAFDVVNISM